MKLSEFIQQAKQMAGDTDPEVVLFDRFGDRTMRLDSDTDTFDFEIMRGDNEIVIEFD